jgi:hypothetical protein
MQHIPSWFSGFSVWKEISINFVAKISKREQVTGLITRILCFRTFHTWHINNIVVIFSHLCIRSYGPILCSTLQLDTVTEGLIRLFFLNEIYHMVPWSFACSCLPHTKQLSHLLRGFHEYHNSGHYPSSCPLFKTQLNSICLSVPHRKHITSPLRAQQVNAIYRFVTMLYYYNYRNSGHYPSSYLLFKTELHMFVRTSQEIHYVSATSSTG